MSIILSGLFSQGRAEVITEAGVMTGGLTDKPELPFRSRYVESIRRTAQPGLRKTPHKVTAFGKVNQFS